MTRLEELILAWEGDALDEEGRQELKKLLGDPENRARLAEHLHLSEMIVTFFSEQDALLQQHADERPPLKVVPGFAQSFRKPVEQQTGRVISFPRWPLATAAALLLAVAVTLTMNAFGGPPVVATVGEVQGLVVARSEAGERAIEPYMAIRSGDELLGRGPKTGLLLIYPDGSWVRIDGESAITVSRSKTEQRVHLSRGRLMARLQKQPPKRPFIFSTAQATATVLGTRLGLEIEQKATRLRVDEGRVRLTRLSDGRSVEVGAGNTAVAAAGLPLRATPMVVASVALGSDGKPNGPVAHLAFDGSEPPSGHAPGTGSGPLVLRRSDAPDGGAVEHLIAGRRGQALQSDRFSATIEHSGSFAPQRLSLSLWFRLSRSASTLERPVLLDKESAERQSGFSLRGFELQEGQEGERSQRVEFGIWTDLGRKSVSCHIQEPELWNHVAVAFDGDSLKMFCNGQQQQAVPTGAAALLHDDREITLGRFIGLLDEVRLYDRALAEEEVRELATE